MSQWQVLALCVLAFFCLALSMERHQVDLFKRRLNKRPSLGLKGVAWAILAVSLLICLREPHWGVALVAWFGSLSAAAGIVYLGLLLVSRLTPSHRSMSRPGD